MLIGVGGNDVVVCGCTNLDCTKVGYGVSCPHRHVQFNSQRYVGWKPNWKMWPIDYICISIIEQCREKIHHNQKGSANDGICSSQILPLLIR
jgi:hypothetical protein